MVVKVAVPLLTTTADPPEMAAPLLLKLTVPPLTVLELITVAVKVTELLGAVANEGLRLEVMVVVVLVGGIRVKFRLHPELILTGCVPVILPKFTAYKDHKPFGFDPAKALDRDEIP